MTGGTPMHIGRVFLKSTEVDFVHFIAANLFAGALSVSDSLAIFIPQPQPPTGGRLRECALCRLFYMTGGTRPLPVILYDRRHPPSAGYFI